MRRVGRREDQLVRLSVERARRAGEDLAEELVRDVGQFHPDRVGRATHAAGRHKGPIRERSMAASTRFRMSSLTP